jgi:hypothetical protein
MLILNPQVMVGLQVYVAIDVVEVATVDLKARPTKH